MSPVWGATSKYPSPTFHFAGPPSAARHLERSVPSNSTMAPDGGRPAWSWVLGSPGVITGGCGRFRSWIFHRASGVWAPVNCVSTRAPITRRVAATTRPAPVRIVLRIGITPFSSCRWPAWRAENPRLENCQPWLPVYQSSFRTAASALGENRRALRRADHRAVEGCDLRDQSREIMSEHSLAIPAAPRAFFDLDVVPVDAPAEARHLQSLSALSLHYSHVLGS